MMPLYKLSRPGFTLVEAIVAVAILGILVSLLVPAVQQAREVARRAACRNNLRQIGQALHAYHDARGCLPFGVLRHEGYNGGWPWHVYLLPYLDQAPLYEKVSPNGQPNWMLRYFEAHGRIIPGAETVIPVMRCPSSTLPSHVTDLGGPGVLPEYVRGYAAVDFKGCDRGSDGLGMLVQGGPGWSSLPVRFALVLDGMSTTIMVGEGSTPGPAGNRWPKWVGTTTNKSEALFTTTARYTEQSLAGRYWMNIHYDRPVSMHSGGGEFLFADGSVRTVAYGLDYSVWRGMGSRDGTRPKGPLIVTP